jgi:sulfur carrier protein
MMKLRVNGKDRDISGPCTVGELLARLNVDRRIVAVELRGEILDRNTFDEARLKDGDNVEIVRMIGGGSE